MKLRVVIADDELLSRDRLRDLLTEEVGIELVGECSTGTQVLRAIRESSPDLVFLDIKMPDLDGFGVIEKLAGTRSPAIIFVTAYDHFALRAFEVHAVDYLLKPFDQERFRTALARARRRLRDADGVPSAADLSTVLRSLPTPPKAMERLTVKAGGKILLINTTEIDWICAADNYAELHVGKTSYFLRITLNSLAEQLPPGRFLRISRSHLVQVDRIKELQPKSHGDCVILLLDGRQLCATRNYRANWAYLLRNAG
jgi:two-component system LytT family response regulator